MTVAADLARLRLRSQHLIGPRLATPDAVVAHLGAVQSQDYYGACWAIGLRSEGASAATVDALFDAGAILRTHVLRPTWHFVTPADLRWLLALTGSRVHAANAGPYRETELDAETLTRSRAVLVDALEGGRFRTRDELSQALAAAGIVAVGRRLGYALMHAEVEALICSGPRRGKQFTYALVDERVPPSPPKPRDEAIAELARRYIGSHGPATEHDFAWWSGLPVRDARAGFADIQAELDSVTADGRTYWCQPNGGGNSTGPVVHLLPNYDELVVAYRDHDPSLDPDAARALPPNRLLPGMNAVTVDGYVVGAWRQARATRRVAITLDLLRPFTAPEWTALRVAAGAYARFLALPVELAGAP